MREILAQQQWMKEYSNCKYYIKKHSDNSVVLQAIYDSALFTQHKLRRLSELSECYIYTNRSIYPDTGNA